MTASERLAASRQNSVTSPEDSVTAELQTPKEIAQEVYKTMSKKMLIFNNTLPARELQISSGLNIKVRASESCFKSA